MSEHTRLVASGPAFDRAGLIHRVREPANPGPRRTVVMLHGRSGNEDVMWVFARALPADWLIVAPRAPTPDPKGGYAWHPRKPDEWPALRTFDDAVEAVARFIHALPDQYGADPAHIYLMGFSQGAATAYATALRYPNLVKGIAGLVGFMPTDNEAAVASAPLAGLPVLMAVGRNDPRIPLAVARQCASALRTAGARLDYHEYDVGHKLDAQGMRDLAAWWGKRGAEGDATA